MLHSMGSQSQTRLSDWMVPSLTVVFLDKGFPCISVGKESTCTERDLGSIPWSGKFPAEGNGNPLQWQAGCKVGHSLATKPPQVLKVFLAKVSLNWSKNINWENNIVWNCKDGSRKSISV